MSASDKDGVAISLARGLAAAERRARESGIDAADSLVTITQIGSDRSKGWRVNYGPKAYINRRGGDLIVEVDAADATIRSVIRGQ
jgi:hypothetical protein